MAPKKRAVGKQAPKAAASSPSSAASKRCQEDRRNAEESVKRGLADHCASLSAYVIYDLLNEEGHSLYTKALAKKESLTKRQRISSQWWRETINEFVNLAGSMAGMTVTNPAEVVDAQLDKALDLLDSSNTTRRSSSALRSWMSTCTAMNQRSLVGLIRAVSSLNSSSKNAAEVIMDMGELLHRLDIKARHPVEFQHAKSIVDQALVTMYACERRDSDNAKFVEDNKAAIEVAADIAIFRGLSAAGVDFAARREDISQAIQGSKIGRKMFGGLWMHVATEFVANTIEAKFEGLAENATVDVAFLTAVKAEVLVVAETMCFEDVLNCRRNVTVAYRAVKLKMLVTSLLEEIDLRSRAAVKSLAVGRLLTAMHWEADFGEALVPGGACAVSADLLRKADEARADFNSCLDDGDGQSMDKVMELMRDKRDRFLKKDRFWGIEAEFASVCAGDHGIDVISKRVLQCFPDQQVTKAMPGTMDELKALERTPLYKYSSRSGQGDVDRSEAAPL